MSTNETALRLAYLIVLLASFAFVMSVLDMMNASAQSADLPRYNLNVGEVTIDPDRFAVATEDPEGTWVKATDVDAAIAEAVANCTGGATTMWYPLPLVPEQNERQLLCEVRTGVYAFRDYIDGQWRVGASTGPAPLAWAKINAREVG